MMMTFQTIIFKNPISISNLKRIPQFLNPKSHLRYNEDNVQFQDKKINLESTQVTPKTTPTKSNKLSVYDNRVKFFKIKKIQAGVVSKNYASLKQFPQQLIKNDNVLSLELEHNHIGALPDDIGNMKLLKNLNLAYNKISELPQGFVLLELESLVLSMNHLRECNIDRINSLKLEKLWIDGNYFES